MRLRCELVRHSQVINNPCPHPQPQPDAQPQVFFISLEKIPFSLRRGFMNLEARLQLLGLESLDPLACLKVLEAVGSV